jgi:excisionase family DNA binding protein
MNNEERIRTLLSATPEQLAAVDSALTGSTETVPPSLRLLKFQEAAKETGLSRVTIWRAVKDGHLKAIEIREGSRRIPLAELQRFVSGRKPTGGEA